MRNGQGTYTWSNGDVYKGEWKDNEMNGQGILTDVNGNVLQDGEWENGEFVG